MLLQQPPSPSLPPSYLTFKSNVSTHKTVLFQDGAVKVIGPFCLWQNRALVNQAPLGLDPSGFDPSLFEPCPFGGLSIGAVMSSFQVVRQAAGITHPLKRAESTPCLSQHHEACSDCGTLAHSAARNCCKAIRFASANATPCLARALADRNRYCGSFTHTNLRADYIFQMAPYFI